MGGSLLVAMVLGVALPARAQELTNHAPFRKDQTIPLPPVCAPPDRNLDLP